MPLTHDLPHFKLREFRHPELVDAEAVQFLERVRCAYGLPLVLTSDARTFAENAVLAGQSETSLHLQGRAFDLRWLFDRETLWRLVAVVFSVAAEVNRGVELEVVNARPINSSTSVCFPMRAPTDSRCGPSGCRTPTAACGARAE